MYHTFSLTDTSVLDPYLMRAALGEANYLLSLDADRLLANFRLCAGLDTLGKTCYGGWENGLIGGHTMGHYLTALAQSWCDPGLPPVLHRAVEERLAYMAESLRRCQLASKGKPGFLFGAKAVDFSKPEEQFDLVEQGRADIFSEAWVPWYTMHKILAGLISVWQLTGNKTALAAATDLGGWVAERVLSWNEQTRRTTLAIEYGGMNDAMYDLYIITGQEEFCRAAHQFDEVELFEKILNQVPNALNNVHANTTIPKFAGALNRYLAAGEETYLRYAEAFFRTVVEHHTYITGGNSEWEHFGLDSVLDAERTNANCETCNAYNMLKMARKLWCITGRQEYLDFYERAYFNSILSSRNPETGMTTYFQPMASGFFKVYSTPDTNFWCCTGTGMENFTKLSDSIYYAREKEITVALYVSSTLRQEGFTLVQTADLEKGVAEFSFRGDADRALNLRIPGWMKDIRLEKNGAAVETLSGPFADGDVVTLRFTMAITTEGLQDNPDALAFRYGPYVLSADLGAEDMVEGKTGVDVTIPAAQPVGFAEEVALPYPVSDLRQHPEDYLQPTADGDFLLKGTSLRFGLHYRRYQTRYGIYFRYHS